MEEKELWMNKLKEKLADYSEPAPASGWEQLEKELMPPVEKKIYPYRKWMMAAAAVIILAVVSSVSLYFLGTPAADEIRHIQIPRPMHCRVCNNRICRELLWNLSYGR